ncbi:MAG: hypothetical protein DRH49_02320 [Candidatus Coatesbacteria bacterium]|nr:MAG: hypothetical protein DRH49_02320 [Candidatus Coatesbacteria bacterium]
MKQKLLCIVIISLFLIINCSSGGTTEYREAVNLQKRGEYEKAIEIYLSLTREYDNRGVGIMAQRGLEECRAIMLYQKAIYELNFGDREEANETAKRAAKLYYLVAEAQYIKAMNRFLDGDIEGAERMFIRIIRDNPALPYGYMGLGRVDEEVQRYTSSVLNYSKALKLSKDKKINEIVFSGIERCMEINQDNPLIMGVIEDTSNKYGASSTIYYYLGRYFNTGEEPNYQKAISYLSRALSSEGYDESMERKIYIEMARAYEGAGHKRKALSYIDKALVLGEDDDLKIWKKRIESHLENN